MAKRAPASGGERGREARIVSIDGLELHSWSQPGEAGIDYKAIAGATNSILVDRSRRSVQNPPSVSRSINPPGLHTRRIFLVRMRGLEPPLPCEN